MRFAVGSWPSLVVGAVGEGVRNARQQNFPFRRAALAFGVVLTLAGCNTIDSMFEGDPPPPTARTSGGAAPAQSGTSNDEKDYPRLSTVPARPTRPTPPPQQGLAADRASARYADNEVRPVNEAADAVIGQRLGASAPAAAPLPGPEAGPPAAAPVTPVQSAPPTPMQPQSPPESSVQPPSAAPSPAAPPPPAAQAAVAQSQEMAQPQEMAQSPAQAPIQSAPPMPAPTAASLPPPPAPSQQALVLPPTTRPAVSAVTGRSAAAAAAPAPAYHGNNIQVAVVQFGRASSGLSGDDLTVLRDVAEIQKKQGGTIRVVGHASQDVTGSDVQRLQEGNYAISLARANAIANQLVRFGVPRSAVVAEAAGDVQPEYDPVNPVAVASNRRAEIFLAF